MTQVALLFPGQGAQKVGMGKEFYDSFPQAKAIFDEAEAILNNDLKSAIFDGPQEKLTLTKYCQPAIFTFSVAALKTLQIHPKYKNINPRFCAGLSLGEYSALVAGEALGFEAGLRLVEKRSSFMEEATKLQKGAMTAIIGFGPASGGNGKRIKEICDETGAQIANFNSHDQIVITGEANKVQEASKRIQEEGAKTVIPLDVSGAFHSSLMQPAADKFKTELNMASIGEPKVPIIANVNGLPEIEPDEIRENLSLQITSSVQWVGSIEYMAKEGITDFIEIGPGRVLKGLLRKIDRNLKCYNIEKPEDIENLPF